jgi:arsenate reductase
MDDIKIYQKPTCSTCRQAVQLLKESGKSFTAINYYDQPFTKAHLKALLKKAGLAPKDVLRTKEDQYKELKLAQKEVSDDDLIDLMIKYPDLLQRPLVETKRTAFLARPADTITRLL